MIFVRNVHGFFGFQLVHEIGWPQFFYGIVQARRKPLKAARCPYDMVEVSLNNAFLGVVVIFTLATFHFLVCASRLSFRGDTLVMFGDARPRPAGNGISFIGIEFFRWRLFKL